MTRISIEQGFSWMQRFLQREWALVLPVALAFLALPPLAAELLVPADRRMATLAAAADPAQAVRVLAAMLPALVAVVIAATLGALAITALALVPGISVREALALALRRFPVQFGASLLVSVALTLVAVAVTVGLLLLGLPPLTAQLVLQPLIVAAAAVLSVRLLLLTPLVVDRPVGVFAALRQGWRMTARAAWRLAGGVAVFLVGGIVVLLAVQWALGGLLLAAGQAAGQPELGRALAALVSALASATVSSALFVLLAGFYRQAVSSSGT